MRAGIGGMPWLAAALGAALLLGAPAPGQEPARGSGAAADSITSSTSRPELPVPVLLVPGWSDGRSDLEELRDRFLAAGWDTSRVAIVDFRDPVGSNREHAREVAMAAAELREVSGAGQVDVVAHSMGGLAVRYHLRNRPLPTIDVRRVVFLATPHFGTYSSLVAWGAGAREMYPGSDFLMTLMQGRPLPYGVEALTIRTPLDLHILPPESAVIPGVPDLQVCCPTHAGLLSDPQVFRRIEAFLRTGTDGVGDGAEG